LHPAELVQREHCRNVERQGLDIVDGQTGPVWVGKAVEIPWKGPRGGDYGFAVSAPNPTGYVDRITQVVQVIRQQFLLFTHSHAVDFRGVCQNPVRIEGGEDSADEKGIFGFSALSRLAIDFTAG